MRVLVVDDQVDTVELMAELMEQLGHECRTAGSAKEALSVAETFEADLALVDVGLPDVSGYELFRALRARCARRPTYIVALTGYMDAQRKAVEAGADQCLLKPASRNQLMAAVALAAAGSKQS